MFRLVRAAFNQRRKTLQNALHNMPELNLSKEQVVNALKEMGLSETIRGEKLTLEEFAKLSDLLTK
jgi:16S rRNA (adenine1518-N6/adenine1519-N6)-dimethyltransferase